MSTVSIVILTIGFVCLFIGLGLYIITTRRGTEEGKFYTSQLICWLLIALFPPLVIYSLFPQSSMNGNLFGFSMTGAGALFVFMWWFGTKNSLKAMKLDDLLSQIQVLKSDLARAQAPRSGQPDQPKVLETCEVHPYPTKRYKKKKIALITGNLMGVRVADIWVNSENTNMQMSRFYERSISGTIRYLGAKKDMAGEVEEDSIMNELSKLMNGRTSVQPATVLVTDAGELSKTHNVKKIFHVASVRGQVASGYQPIDNIGFCIHQVLDKADSLGSPCKSILFPLLGTGTAKAKAEVVVAQLIDAALSYLEAKETTTISTVYFLAWTDRDLEICRTVLEKSGRVDG